MEEGFSQGSVPIILGKSFMKTARTKIDIYAGTLSMEFGDITVHFNIFDAMKHPSEDVFVFRAEIIDHIVDEYITDLHSNLHACHCSCIDLNLYLIIRLNLMLRLNLKLILIICLVMFYLLRFIF